MADNSEPPIPTTLGKAWEDFKRTNDARLAAVEATSMLKPPLERKLIVQDGNVCWLCQDGSHRCLTEWDIETLNRLIAARPMANSSLIEKLESLKYPNAKSGSHMESGNGMVDVCIAIVRRHYEERSAVDGKPIEIQSRDELLAFIRKQEAAQDGVEAFLKEYAIVKRCEGGWYPLSAEEQVTAIAAIQTAKGM